MPTTKSQFTANNKCWRIGSDSSQQLALPTANTLLSEQLTKGLINSQYLVQLTASHSVVVVYSDKLCDTEHQCPDLVKKNDKVITISHIQKLLTIWLH